jgi:protoporphyrinogen oxidase
MNIAIIGGGIQGLSLAYYLLTKTKHSVCVFETEDHTGGLAGCFNFDGESLEKYYHHIFTSDSEILELCNALGLFSKIIWKKTNVGIFHKSCMHPFSTPCDILQFPHLLLHDRIRFCCATAYVKYMVNLATLDSTSVQEWFERLYGKRIYKTIWEPLLRGKFGRESSTISATWLCSRIKKRSDSRKSFGSVEQLGYISGSLKVLFDRLEECIRERGGVVYRNCAVKKICQQGGKVVGVETKNGFSPFSSVVSTIALPQLADIVVMDSSLYWQQIRAIKYQAILCAVMVLKKQFMPYYWLNISDDKIPFTGIIEHTNFIDPERYHDKHICYITNYLKSSDPLFVLSDTDLVDFYSPFLKRISPDFEKKWIEKIMVFRDEFGTPIYTRDYFSLKPAVKTPITGLYILNTTQLYPENRGINFSVKKAKECASDFV